MKKVLIVEDQKNTLRILQKSIQKVLQQDSHSFIIEVAEYYSKAEDLIVKKDFDFIFLDHRLPLNDVGNLEDEDFDKYSDILENIGYGLISLIKKRNPATIVIGTSSLEKKNFKDNNLDYSINKLDLFDSLGPLEKILKHNS